MSCFCLLCLYVCVLLVNEVFIYNDLGGQRFGLWALDVKFPSSIPKRTNLGNKPF